MDIVLMRNDVHVIFISYFCNAINKDFELWTK